MALNTELKTIETKLTNLKVSLDEKLTAKGAVAGANLTESVGNVATISTGKPEEQKTVQIKQNGQTEVLPSEGNVLTKITIQTGVPVPLLEDNKTQKITANGTVEIVPTPGNDAMKKATVNVNVQATGGAATFADLGYEKGTVIGLGDPTTIQKDIEYGKKLKDEWNPDETSLLQKYYGNNELVYFPKVNTSNVTQLNSCFSWCSSLTTIPQLDTSKVTNMDSCFYGCSSLIYFPKINTSMVSNFDKTFCACKSLENITQLDFSSATILEGCFSSSNLKYLPTLNTSKTTNWSTFCQDCKELTTVEMLDMNSASEIFRAFYNCDKLRYLLIKNLGKNVNIKEFWVGATWAPAPWGVNDENNPAATHSLVDTLLTYSFDRTAAGYEPCTVTLSEGSKAVLTEDQKAAIAAKGYTIA